MITRNTKIQSKPAPANQHKQGMGFLWFGDYEDYYYENGSGGGGGFWDMFGDDGDWRGYGGGDYYYDLPYAGLPSFDYWPSPGIDAGSPYGFDSDVNYYEEYLRNLLYNPGGIEQGYGFDLLPGNSGGSNGSGSGWSWDSFWEWARDLLAPSPTPSLDWQGPTSSDANLNAPYPGYCPRGTYHPVNDPYSCVPFPPNDPNAQKQARQQQQQQQRAAQSARAAQKKQDQACPKDPAGRPVWRNPQTGKCELAPQCPQGSKFDSTTRRCLTPQQAKDVYGDDYTWLWWVSGGVLLLAALNRRRR